MGTKSTNHSHDQLGIVHIVTTATRTVREVTADSPRGVAQIFIWMGLGPTRQSSLLPLFLQSRAERSSSSRAIVAPCFDLPPPPTRPRFLAQEPSSSPTPPSQTPKPAYPRPESFHHRRTPLGVLEACSPADPPLRSSSTRTDRGNGFVVSPLCFTAFFPLPWRVAGAGARPPPSPPPLLPPSAKVRN